MNRFRWWIFLELFLVILLHLCSMLVAGAVLFHIAGNPLLAVVLLSLPEVILFIGCFFKSKSGGRTPT